MGSGTTAIIFLHELGRKSMCGLADYAGWLAAQQQLRSILLDFCGYGETECTGDAAATPPWKLTAAVVAWARSTGARRVVLIGASAGGGDALVAGAQIRPVVDAVVDLSGDDGDGANMMQAAKALKVPVLYAVAPNDPFAPLATMKALAAHTRSHGTTLQVVTARPGEHGWDLLPDGSGGWSPLAATVAAWATGSQP